jgi:PAS domain S-box-containing protein
MVSLQTLQKIQDNYSLSLGIPIYIKNSEGEALTNPTNPGKLWELIHKNSQTESRFASYLSDAIEKCNRTGQIVLFERLPDTQTFLAPIYAGGKIIAYFIAGLVRYGNPNLEMAEKQAEIMGVNIDVYLDAFLNLPFFTKERLEASANLIRIIGSTIYSLENQGSEIKELNQEIQEKNHQLTKNLELTTKRLQNSESRYKQLFDTANDGIYISDLNDETFLDINNTGAKLLGYNDPKELIGKTIHDMYVFPKDRNNFINILKSKGTIRNWVAHIKTPSGEERYVETNANVIVDNKTKQSFIQGIFRDLNLRQHRSI